MAKLASINIKGKEYVQVHERVRHFNESYPFGAIHTQIEYDGDLIRCKAVVYPNVQDTPSRYFTGHAEEDRKVGMINKNSAVMNAETSAVGRALGMMGIGIIEGFASADEVVGAIAKEGIKPAGKSLPKAVPKPKPFNITDATLNQIQELAKETDSSLDDIDAYAHKTFGYIVPELTESEGQVVVGMLLKKKQASALL